MTHSVAKVIWYNVGVLTVGFMTHAVAKVIWYNVGVLTVGFMTHLATLLWREKNQLLAFQKPSRGG